MDQNMHQDSGPVGRSDSRARWALTVSACVLSALIVVLGGRGFVEPAVADVSTNGGLTMVNLRSGPNNDVIAVLDIREERLFIYTMVGMKDLHLASSEDLRDLFTKAKAASAGNR